MKPRVLEAALRGGSRRPSGPAFTGGRRRAGQARPKVLAGAAMSAALGAGLLSGCGTAPYAATVNGEAISVQQLGDQAREWASSPAFVKYQDAQFAAQEEQALQQGQTNVPNNTVNGNGTGPNVYGMYWTTLQLSNMITALALRQYLAAHHDLPSPLQVGAAWSAEWAQNPAVWREVGPAARSSGAYYDALRAQLVPAIDAKGDEDFYRSHQAYFWTSVCLLTDDISVVGSDGSVDMAASKAEAERALGALKANPSAPPASVANGSRYCDTPEQLVSGPTSFESTVQALAPGQATLVRETWGYQVVQVTSRTVVPFSGAVAAVIEVVTAGGGAQGQPNSESRVIEVLKRAKVLVNPAFGTWATSLPAPYAPQVLPPGETA
jgi:hypothetical protein